MTTKKIFVIIPLSLIFLLLTLGFANATYSGENIGDLTNGYFWYGNPPLIGNLNDNPQPWWANAWTTCIGNGYINYPISWEGETAISMQYNPNIENIGYYSADICELDGQWVYPIESGDHIYFSANIWTGTLTDVEDTDIRGGARMGIDMYGGESGNRISEIGTPDGYSGYDLDLMTPQERSTHYSDYLAMSVHWESGQWVTVTMDFIVRANYICDSNSGTNIKDQSYVAGAFVPWFYVFCGVHSDSQGATHEDCLGLIYIADVVLIIDPYGDPTPTPTSTATPTPTATPYPTPIPTPVPVYPRIPNNNAFPQPTATSIITSESNDPNLLIIGSIGAILMLMAIMLIASKLQILGDVVGDILQ